MKTYKLLSFALTGLMVLGTVACGDDGDDDGSTETDAGGEGELSAAEDACEHMAEGPVESVTALAADSTDPLPAVGEEHTRFDITLVAGADGMYTGRAEMAADEEGEFILFMNADIPVALFSAPGAQLTVEETNSNVTECTEVAIGHTFDLAVGSYTMEFGPTDQTTVQLVVGHAGEHSHEDE